MAAETENKPGVTPSRQALRMETCGLIFLALVILAVYPVRYFHRLHRSAP